MVVLYENLGTGGIAVRVAKGNGAATWTGRRDGGGDEKGNAVLQQRNIGVTIQQRVDHLC
jgi:hypothetical protein